MKLVIDRGELLRGLGHVTSVVEKRTTIPILSNVLLRTSQAGLELRATDLEREVVEETRADVVQPGAATSRRTRSTTSRASCLTAPRSRFGATTRKSG